MRAPDPDGPNDGGASKSSPAPKRPRSDMPPARFVGFAIDHFSIGRQLGWGGMGAVYLARDTSLERTVAVKAPLCASNAGALHRAAHPAPP